MNADAVFANIQAIPTDWFIIGGIALLAAFITVRSGAERMCTLALALPAATLLHSLIGSATFLETVVSQFSTPALQAVLFALIVVAMYFIVSRIGLSYGGGSGHVVTAALTGVATAAILLVMWVQTPELSFIWQFQPDVQAIFGGGWSLWWLLISFGALAYVRS